MQYTMTLTRGVSPFRRHRRYVPVKGQSPYQDLVLDEPSLWSRSNVSGIEFPKAYSDTLETQANGRESGRKRCRLCWPGAV